MHAEMIVLPPKGGSHVLKAEARPKGESHTPLCGFYNDKQ
jgi:hypothetical protein